MSCFYYDKEAGIFRPHKDEYKPCIEEDNLSAPVQLNSLSLFLAIKAEKLVTDCLWQVFQLSSHFNSRLRVLNLRGFTEMSSESL